MASLRPVGKPHYMHDHAVNACWESGGHGAGAGGPRGGGAL